MRNVRKVCRNREFGAGTMRRLPLHSGVRRAGPLAEEGGGSIAFRWRMSRTTASMAHPAARGWAVVLRIEPQPCGPCLDPDGLPSLAQQPAAARRDEQAGWPA